MELTDGPLEYFVGLPVNWSLLMSEILL